MKGTHMVKSKKVLNHCTLLDTIPSIAVGWGKGGAYRHHSLYSSGLGKGRGLDTIPSIAVGWGKEGA